MVNTPDLSIILPCYNESESLDDFFNVVINELHKTKLSFEIICLSTNLLNI